MRPSPPKTSPPRHTPPGCAAPRGAGEPRRRGAAVPCGECRGCRTSAYFIPIAPDETDTLSHIPKALLFPAPGLPKGHRLLGYRENGHCPMFIDNACSIYPHRPRLPAIRLPPVPGLPTAVEEGKPRIAAQAARWRFAFPRRTGSPGACGRPGGRALPRAACRGLSAGNPPRRPGAARADRPAGLRGVPGCRGDWSAAGLAPEDAAETPEWSATEATRKPAAGPVAPATNLARNEAMIRSRIAAILDCAGLVPPGAAPAQ